MTKKVELHYAFFFDCEECGRAVLVYPELWTLERVVSHEDSKDMTEEEKEMWTEFLEAEGGMLLEKPGTVTCSHEDCGASFEVAEDEE